MILPCLSLQLNILSEKEMARKSADYLLCGDAASNIESLEIKAQSNGTEV
jgi:hypothetical protein